jgi:hypothetical protein
VLVKRGGRLSTFQGLPCYQVEGRFHDGRTCAGKVFAANGFCYVLLIMGSDKPVEQEANFEAIMNGFAFLETPPDPNAQRLAYRFAGHAIVGCFGALVLFLIVLWISGWRLRSSADQPAHPLPKGHEALGQRSHGARALAGSSDSRATTDSRG